MESFFRPSLLQESMEKNYISRTKDGEYVRPMWTPFVFLAELSFCLCCLVASPPSEGDRVALQECIDALPAGGTLTLGARAYHFQDLRITRSLTIQGAGRGRTLCDRGGALPFFRLTGKAAEVTIKDLALDGQGLAAAGIEAMGIKTLRLEGLRVARCGQPPTGALPSDRFGKPVDGVYARDVLQAEVRGCALVGNGRDGFIGIPVRRLFFTNNECTGNGRMGCTSDVDPGGKLGGPLQVVYQDNEVANCGTGGLHVESEKGLPAVDALFERNRVINCGDRDWGYSWGLVMGYNSKGVLRGNTVTGLGLRSTLKAYRNGILVSRPGGPVLIEGNTVEDTGRAGISVNESTFPVKLKGNLVRGGRTTGIAVYMVPDLLVENCTVEGCQEAGFWGRLCAGALIQGNHFRDNSRQAQGKFPAMHGEACPNIRILNNDLGGPPQSMGVELVFTGPTAMARLEGNTFAGARRHVRLSSFKTEN